MIKIEDSSVFTKNDIVSKVIKDVQENNLSDSFHIIRGNAINSNNYSLLDINSTDEYSVEIKGLIHECKNNKKSRHQVDFVVAAFVNEISISSAENLNSLTQEERDGTVNSTFKEAVEKEPEKTLCIFVLSEDSVEMITYGIVQSLYKGSLTTVMSSDPILNIKGTNEDSKVIIGKKGLTDFFKLSDSEKRSLEESSHASGFSLQDDIKLFPKASEYITNRNNEKGFKSKYKNKSKIKFGY
jgi:hypothetical protein